MPHSLAVEADVGVSADRRWSLEVVLEAGRTRSLIDKRIDAATVCGESLDLFSGDDLR